LGCSQIRYYNLSLDWHISCPELAALSFCAKAVSLIFQRDSSCGFTIIKATFGQFLMSQKTDSAQAGCEHTALLLLNQSKSMTTSGKTKVALA